MKQFSTKLVVIFFVLSFCYGNPSLAVSNDSVVPAPTIIHHHKHFQFRKTVPVYDSINGCLHPKRIMLKTFSARLAFRMSGGDRRYKETISINTGKGELLPYSEALPLFHNHKESPNGLKHCKFTNQDSIMDASDLTVSGRNKRHTERGWVNYLLGNFIYGNYPENILFPVNGDVSSYLYNALTVKKALKTFFDHNRNTDQNQHFNHRSDFFIADLFATLPRPISVKHFVGSVDIIITPVDDSLISLTIFNITSITSADYSTHFKRQKKWPRSIPRQFTPQPYSNSGQVFQLLLTLPEAKKLAGIKK